MASTCAKACVERLHQCEVANLNIIREVTSPSGHPEWVGVKEQIEAGRFGLGVSIDNFSDRRSESPSDPNWRQFTELQIGQDQIWIEPVSTSEGLHHYRFISAIPFDGQGRRIELTR
jgi:hypothetical protein